MKSNNEFRAKGHVQDPEEKTKKAVKLPPIKKSGKERHSLYSSLEDDDELPLDYKKRESVLDYFDDTDEDMDEDQFEDDEGEDDWEEDGGEDEEEDYE